MEKISYEDEERWLLSNSTQNSINIYEDEDEDEDEDETPSFCDLPVHNSTKQEKVIHETTQEEFNFCRSLSDNSQMCSADEIFHKGQILPLRRHSASSEKGIILRSISRSESMDLFYSGGLLSSRSSSINSSHQSSSSGSSSTTTTRGRQSNIPRPKPPPNQFHSHPSPSPRIHKQGNRNTNCAEKVISNKNKKSSIWSVLRLGLVVTPPPEIVFQDLKTRNNNNNNYGSRNSTNSRSSHGTGIINDGKLGDIKKKKRVFLGGGCKCAIDALDTVPSRVVLMKSPKQQETKKRVSHHRTFEWLKQLSLEEAEEP